jgi:putative transposase
MSGFDSESWNGANQGQEVEPGPAEQMFALTGQDGLLTVLVADVLQLSLEVEMAAHVGHPQHGVGGGVAENVRNGSYARHLWTDLGMVEIQMPRDRLGTFEPVTVPKRGRRILTPMAELAGLYASGITHAEMRSQLDRMTHFRLTSEITDAFTCELELAVRVWQRRRFESSYPMLLIDSISLGSGRPPRHLDVAITIDAYDEAELLGVWRRPTRSPDTNRWSAVVAELDDRGLTDARTILAINNPDLRMAAAERWPGAEVRSGVEHLIENSLR